MFHNRSVIVVGAGASAEYELPLGDALCNDVQYAVSELRRTFDAHRRDYPGETAASWSDHIAGDDPKGAAGCMALSRIDRTIEWLDEQFKERLVHGNLDDFVRDNPAASEPVRALIAGRLIEGLYESHGPRWILKEHLARKLGPHKNDWIRPFVGLMRGMLADISDPKPVTIVSFNYDFVFEHSLRALWNLSEREYPPVESCFRFVYPHGSFEALPDRIEPRRDFVLKQAARIRIGGNADEASEAEAREAVQGADAIYWVGFSFGPTNVALLKPSDADMKNSFVQNVGHNPRINRVIARLGYRTPVDVGKMKDLVASGFFEQGMLRG